LVGGSTASSTAGASTTGVSSTAGSSTTTGSTSLTCSCLAFPRPLGLVGGSTASTAGVSSTITGSASLTSSAFLAFPRPFAFVVDGSTASSTTAGASSTTAGVSSSLVLSSASSNENLGISILGLPLPPLLVFDGLAMPLPLAELLLLALVLVVASLLTLAFLALEAVTASSTAFLLPFPALDVDGSSGVVSTVTTALATTIGSGVFTRSATPVRSSRAFLGPFCG